MASQRNGVPDSSSQRAGGGEGAREPLAPGQLLAEVVGLVGDHERGARALALPARRRARHAGVGDGDAVEVAGRAQLGGVGHEVDAEAAGRLGPLAGQRRGRADDRDAPHRPGPQQLSGQVQRRPRLARARRGGDQERAAAPRAHRHERALLPPPQ